MEQQSKFRSLVDGTQKLKFPSEGDEAAVAKFATEFQALQAKARRRLHAGSRTATCLPPEKGRVDAR